MTSGNGADRNIVICIKDCRHGRFIYWPHDAYVGQALEHYGEYSEGEVEFFAQFLRQQHIVVEVGANIGCHTVALAKMAGCVYAFEPQRLMFQQLCGNIAINGLMNVWTYQQAVGCPTRAGQTVGLPRGLDYRSFNNFGGVHMEADGGDPVPLVKLDDVIKNVNFIKIDCEGMELEVLKGASKIVQEQRPILYVENDRSEKSPDLIRWLQEHDYDLWWHTPKLYNPNNFEGKGKPNIFGPIISLNMMCVPKELAWHVELKRINTPEDQWLPTA